MLLAENSVKLPPLVKEDQTILILNDDCWLVPKRIWISKYVIFSHVIQLLSVLFVGCLYKPKRNDCIQHIFKLLLSTLCLMFILNVSAKDPCQSICFVCF